MGILRRAIKIREDMANNIPEEAISGDWKYMESIAISQGTNIIKRHIFGDDIIQTVKNSSIFPIITNYGNGYVSVDIYRKSRSNPSSTSVKSQYGLAIVSLLNLGISIKDMRISKNTLIEKLIE